MNPVQRWHGQLKPSRWRLVVVALSTIMLALAVLLITGAFWPQWSGAMRSVFALGVALTLSARSWHAACPALALQMQRDDSGHYGFWIQPTGAPALPAPEQALPALLHYRRYFGLYYLRNTQAELLIWPDSLAPEPHRQLRVWLASIRL